VTADSSDIKNLVTAFLEKKLWRDESIRRWLYEDGLQHVMENTIGYYQRQLWVSLEKLAEAAGDPTIATLNEEDGSLDQRYEELRSKYSDLEKYSDSEIEARQAFESVAVYRHNCENISSLLEFLRDEFLPALSSLEKGEKPTRGLQATIEEALDKSGYLFYEFMHDRSWYPATLIPENPRSTYHEIGRFLIDLRKEIVKVTGIEHVYTPLERS